MRTGLRLMFAGRFWKTWTAMTLGIPVALVLSHLLEREWDREAYAMRGRSNLFKEDYRKLKLQDPSKELWT
jgi:hypothetical protein